MALIGRKEEKEKLQSLLYEEEPQFIAVFGRRRIGKTYLIRESFDHNFVFQHTGISNALIEPGLRNRTQLDCFASSLAEAGYPLNRKLKNWAEAFECLKRIIEKSTQEKKVIFIDELSWMDGKKSDLIPSLENFWNGWATARKEKDIVLIVCASATYWMINNIVNSKGGLHNRLTGQIHLKPFTLKECEEYLNSRGIIFNRQQILQCYMIMGGVPYYWSLLKKGKSLAQNIDELFFKENSPLSDEYNNLYAALFNKPEQYIRIIETLSLSNKGITREEIHEKAKIEMTGDLTKKLQELENCGFIRKYIPFGYKKRNCLYQLIDNFTLFYIKFMKENTFEENFWSVQVNTPAINTWNGIAFERVCLEHIPQIKKALGISGVLTEVNSWQCKADNERGIFGSQVDLLIKRKDQIINMCEMKYSDTEYIVNSSFNQSQKKKISDFLISTQTKYAIHYTLITTYGVVKNAYSEDLQKVITIDDLFE